MIPFHVMVVAILVARGVGALAWLPIESWQSATRAGLAVMFVFTATAHFNRTREDLIRTVRRVRDGAGADPRRRSDGLVQNVEHHAGPRQRAHEVP
jgi:hypothetical protein